MPRPLASMIEKASGMSAGTMQLERAVGLDRRVAEDLLLLELGLADRLAHAHHAAGGATARVARTKRAGAQP